MEVCEDVSCVGCIINVSKSPQRSLSAGVLPDYTRAKQAQFGLHGAALLFKSEVSFFPVNSPSLSVFGPCFGAFRVLAACKRGGAVGICTWRLICFARQPC